MMLDTLKRIPPTWWGAIAAAAAAGAAVFSSHKILGGLVAGGAMFYVAHKATAPCCAGCADGAGCDGAGDSPSDAGGGLFGDAPAVGGPLTTGGCVGCDGMLS